MINSTVTHKDVTPTHYCTQVISVTSRIEVNGLILAESGPYPPPPSPRPEVHRSCRKGTSVRLSKSWPTSSRMDLAQHGPFSNRSWLQRTLIWVLGGAISQFGHSGIRMFLGVMAVTRVTRF